MKRRCDNAVDVKAIIEEHESLMADIEEAVIARNRHFDLDRCDMTLVLDIEAQSEGDCNLLRKWLKELRDEISKKKVLL